MELNRRQWLKTASLVGGFTLLNGFQALSAEEIKKFNPRKLVNPVRLSSNENPYGPSEGLEMLLKLHLMM